MSEVPASARYKEIIAIATDAAARNSTDPAVRAGSASTERHALADAGVWARASAQSRAARPVVCA